jgi:transcriptional regulator GlxA family with amidase domain
MRNVPDWTIELVAKQRGEVRAEGGLGLIADRTLEEVDSADILLVPGGFGNRPLLEDGEVLDWLRRIDSTTRWTTSVCTGSLVLGAAGLLEGKRATGNWLYLEPLREYGADPVGGRWVEDGKIVTAAGVTAGIDMALHLVATDVAPEVAQAVQLGIEYDPDPPFDSGHPDKAAPEIVELVKRYSEPVTG